MKFENKTHPDVSIDSKDKLEWQEPSFELLSEPESGVIVDPIETTLGFVGDS